jgi:hypothetical protein
LSETVPEVWRPRFVWDDVTVVHDDNPVGDLRRHGDFPLDQDDGHRLRFADHVESPEPVARSRVMVGSFCSP